MKQIYVMLSRTQTRFAKVIRLFGKQNYNHASLILDEERHELYAFARPQHNVLLMGGLMKETVDRYTLRKSLEVPVAAYAVTVSDEEYEWIKAFTLKMHGDPQYMYSLFSVLTYPITKGFSVENAFTCVEYVAYILDHAGIISEKKCCRYTPDDLSVLLEDNCIYKGDIRGFLPKYMNEDAYFAPFKPKHILPSIKALFQIMYRSCFCRVKR